MNLDDFPIQSGPREMAGAAFVKEQMKDHSIKGPILRMTVPVPVCNVHVQFNIAFQDLFPIHPEGGMNEIGARFPIPKSKLNDLDEGTGYRAESGTKSAGIPHGRLCQYVDSVDFTTKTVALRNNIRNDTAVERYCTWLYPPLLRFFLSHLES
jgi:hypothetical protein